MAILHKNISAEGDIHNPKWFSGANNGDVAWRNELGVLESTDELVLPAALDFVDGSAAPPTSNSGDIYVLSSGASVNAGWGTVAVGDWVRYDGTTWNVITPQKSSLCYNETTDALNSYDGSIWSAIGSGGGGGDSIYTADGTIGTGRVATLTDTLKIEGGQTYIDSGSLNPLVINRKGSGALGNGIDFNAYNSSNAETNFARIIQVATDTTAGSEDGGLWFRAVINGNLRTPLILDDREFLIDAEYFTDNNFRVKDGATDCLKVTTSKQTYVESGGFNPLVINRKSSGVNGVGIDLNAYNSSNIEHSFARIVQVATDITSGSEDGGLWLRVSDNGNISTKVQIDVDNTEIKNKAILESTLDVYGTGTAGSSALTIYDNDTTPNKLWDFLDNGNVNLGSNSVVNQDSNVLQFSNINSIGGLKFNGTSNNGIGINIANDDKNFDFVVAGSSNTVISTGSLGLLVGGGWAMQVKQNKEISIGANFEPVPGYDLSVDKAYFDTEITVKSPAGIMQFNGYRSHNIDPSTATFPNDKDFGVHKNTSSGDVFLAFNDGGTIKKVQLT